LLDIGARSEKIRSDAISLDIDVNVRPDVCASAECLPFKTGSFDYISMLEVIEHLSDDQLERALGESKRVGNFVVVSTPNCDSKVWNRVIWPLWSHTVGREWIGAHKQFFGRESISEILEKVYHMKILEKNYSRWSLLLLARTNPVPKLKKNIYETTMELSPRIGKTH
jgi:ubiquinone/menaquinone biosynthesis C-methylase UbiE